MTNSIKSKILEFLKDGNWRYGGSIEDHIRSTDGAKASNASRRCRELEDEGKIERRIVKFDGKNVVQYRLISSKTYLHSPILRKKDFCCASHWLGKPHDPKCFQLKKPQEQKVSQPQSLF